MQHASAQKRKKKIQKITGTAGPMSGKESLKGERRYAHPVSIISYPFPVG